jgi:hypothetical protein
VRQILLEVISEQKKAKKYFFWGLQPEGKFLLGFHFCTQKLKKTSQDDYYI